MTKLSVVTTIFKTGHCVSEFHKLALEAAEAIGADLETIFVNDGSPDNGWDIASELASRDRTVVAIDLARNVGQHRALFAGLEIASGDFVAIFDGDLEEDPRWLVQFFHLMKERNCDVVYGIQEVSNRGPLYRMCRRIFYRLVNTLSSIQLPENVATARLMSRRYVDAVLKFEEREIFLAGLLYVAGFLQLPMKVFKTSKSPTTYHPLKLISLFINNVTSFSVRPLIGMFLLGAAILLIAAIMIVALLIQRLVFGIGIPGWASIVTILALSSGLTIFFNGVIAIYVATIFLEVKRRPRSIIKNIVRS